MTFKTFFRESTGKLPHRWQETLSTPSECGDRLIRIPTGFGKTLGVLTVWLWHRVVQKDEAWPRRQKHVYLIIENEQRPGLRHELPSTLCLIAVLQRHKPDHEALLGPWREWFSALDESEAEATASEPHAVEQEILELSAAEFDLLAYIVCACHGKVRLARHSSPSDQKAEDTELPIGVARNGDLLPPITLASENGELHQLPVMKMDLSPSENGLSTRTGRSWTDQTLGLPERYGPFSLAWLETLSRAADQRASKESNSDTLLVESQLSERSVDNVRTEVERINKTLARIELGTASTPSSESDSEPRRELYGHGRGASERDLDSGTARAPFGATRLVETEVSILSYQALAPLVAERVGHTEFDISVRKFAELRVEDLLLELQYGVCGDLLPRIAGKWRIRDVQVGTYVPPPHLRVPIQMRAFSADLDERLSNLNKHGQIQSLNES